MSRRLLFLALTAWLFTETETGLFAQAKAAAQKAAPAAQPKPNAGKAAPNAATPAAKADMVLGRLISDGDIFFVTTNGWKKAAANTTNKTEKLWAEQSVQDFFEQLSDEIKLTISHQTQGNEAAALAATTMPVFLNAMLQHPAAVSLISVTMANEPEFKLSIVIDTESDANQVREALEKLVDATPEEGPNSLDEETIEEVTFYSPNVPDSEKTRVPQFGMYKSYLLLTFGEGTTAETIKKLKATGKSPAIVDKTLRELNVDRPSVVWQVNVEAIRKIVEPLVTDDMVRTIVDATGLMSIKRVASVTGLDAVGTVDKFVIETDGAPSGILALIPNKPLTAADLKGVPANAAQAHIIRFDLEQFVEGILKIADKVDPMPRQQFDQFSVQGEQILGFSIKDDLLKSFGDVWSTYVSSTEAGGGLVPGLVVSAKLRDEKKLAKVNNSIVELAKNYIQQMGPQSPVTLQDFTARGSKGYRIQINNLPFPVSPSWIVAKEQFVFGLTPQLVTAHLGAVAATTSLADNEDVKAAMKKDPKTILLSYRDPKPEVQAIYTLVNSFSPLLLGQMRQQGVEFNLPPLPPFSDIEPHLSPSVSTVSQTANGWRSESHGVIPSFSAATPAIAAVGVGLLLPATQQAREAARRAQAKNCLKQIGLAMHNYHSTFNRFPERVVLDKDGKPGLSWRVKLLPYLGEEALYNEFHLDEPWDSEHNKTLIEKMPAAFASPNDPELSKEGKTRFMVLVGDGTLFDGEEGPGIASITDGTSNTIMAVEANSDSAVVWTQPEDLELDDDDLVSGFEGARIGGFHILLADGSVRFVSINIDRGILHALITKAGGEVMGDF